MIKTISDITDKINPVKYVSEITLTSTLNIIKNETIEINKRIDLLERNQKRNNWINKRRCS